MNAKTITLKSNQINCPRCYKKGSVLPAMQVPVDGIIETITVVFICDDCNLETVPMYRKDLAKFIKREATKRKNDLPKM